MKKAQWHKYFDPGQIDLSQIDFNVSWTDIAKQILNQEEVNRILAIAPEAPGL